MLMAGMLLASVFIQVTSEARDDWELWTELRWKKPVSERLTLQGTSSFRFRRDLGEFYRHFDEVGLGYKWLSWLKVEGAYQWNYSERPKTHDPVYEHRLYTSVIPQLSVGRLQLENRNRLEWRHINGVDDWRYRNRSKASLPLWTGRWWQIKPFVADELFYGFRAEAINRNRVLVGVEKPLSARLAVEVFYVLESNKAGRDWDEFHGLGFATLVMF